MAEEKRKRGRPRKNPVIVAAAPEKPPARRGRPPKKKADEAASTSGNLVYKTVNAWDNPSMNEREIEKFCKGYKAFLNKAKTEREFVREAEELAIKSGFVDIDKLLDNKTPLNSGDKVYRIVKKKLIMLAVIGKKPCEAGTRMVGAHIDSPRVDIKQNPLYESTEMVFMKTHYYGGIKKYQWLAIPLALHGTIIKADGSVIDISIGEDEGDPVFTITDLLPHLAKDQFEKKLNVAFKGEAMNVLAGSRPDADKDAKDRFKLNILKILNEKYGITEEDFISSELEMVPAFKAQDLGFDRSMIGAYGHDDRVCAYPALMAILETKDPEYTAVCILTDKEEIGSVGNTGAQSRALENFLADLCALTTQDQYSDRLLRSCLDRSQMLSADVSAAVDPNFEDTHDKLNAAYLGKGVSIMKFSGSRGKSGASDAHAEFVGEVRRVFNENRIPWHTTELGAVDKGGGGTIAMLVANLGVDVLDVGVPVLSMHAPFEVVSKVDVYAAFKGYHVFIK